MAWHQDLGPRIRERAIEVLAGTGDFLANANDALRASSPDGTAFWHVEVALYSVLFMALGLGLAKLVDRWGRRHFMYMFNPEPDGRVEKLSYLVLRSGMLTIVVGVFTISALAISVLLDSGVAAARQSHFIQIVGVASAWWIATLFRNMFAHDVPSHRLLPIDDQTAATLYRRIVVIFAITIFVICTCLWMDALGLDRNAHILSLVMGSLFAALMFTGLAISLREPVSDLIVNLHHGPAKPLALRLLARTWHVWASLYFLGAWCVVAARTILELPGAGGLVMAPVISLFLGFAAYGLLLLILDKWMGERQWQVDAPDMVMEMVGEQTAAGRLQMAEHRSLKGLAEQGAALLAAVAGIAVMLAFWGVDVSEEEQGITRFGDVLVILFISYFAYQAIKISIDNKIAEEGGEIELEPGEEGGSGGASRLATLLPLARNFLLITVVVMSGMVLLSQLGVDIAPLFAGAGVVGLAIGFGAQTLIRDIFSGAFFLVDDAFRRGEYIDCGVKGTVERISIRSMQLRHHLGALHTIPFGEIQTLTNYSRDWAMMKLSLRVTYDTDVEKVRKLIKNLGKELMEHPEVGDKFLQPLKSQGVLAMEDSAMILRVKFMTKPGEQFVVRKLVYAKIRELFAQEGIEFAHRQVTVRVAPEADGKIDLGSEQNKAALAAALPQSE